MKTSTLIKYLFPHQNSFNLKQIGIYNWRYISYFVLWHCRSIKYVLHKGRVVGCHRASKSLLLSLTVPLTLFSSVQPVPPLTVGVQFRTWNLMVVYKSFEENSILTDSLGTGMTDRRCLFSNVVKKSTDNLTTLTTRFQLILPLPNPKPTNYIVVIEWNNMYINDIQCDIMCYNVLHFKAIGQKLKKC